MDRREEKIINELVQLPKYSKEEREVRATQRLEAACTKVILLDTLFQGLEALGDEDEQKLHRVCHASFFDGLSHITRSISHDINSAEDAGTPAELWDYDLRDLERVAVFKRNALRKEAPEPTPQGEDSEA